MVLAVLLLCSHNLSVPSSFSAVIDVSVGSLNFPYKQQQVDAFSELCLAVFRGRRMEKHFLMHYSSTLEVKLFIQGCSFPTSLTLIIPNLKDGAS